MTGETSFSAFLGEQLRVRREDLIHQWVDTLADQLDLRDGKVLPSKDLLNHMPRVLENVAGFVADADDDSFEELVVRDLGDLAELRRKQGFTLAELLREFHLLAGILRSSVEEAAARYDGPVSPAEVVSVVGRLLDAIHSFSSVTARSFGAWKDRYESERQGLLEIYGQVVSHELSNRLGAAETAVQLLLSSMEVDAEKQRRLLELVLDGIRGGMETIRDVSVLSRPLSEQWEMPGISLPLIIRETVRMARAGTEGSSTTVALVSEAPEVKVPGPPMKIALSNLVSNAVKFSADHAEEPSVRISATAGATAGSIEVVVEDNGPGIPDDLMERIFEYRYRGDVEEEGSGLGLAVARDALQRVGGSIRVENGSESGARFVISIPIDPSE